MRYELLEDSLFKVPELKQALRRCTAGDYSRWSFVPDCKWSLSSELRYNVTTHAWQKRILFFADEMGKWVWCMKYEDVSSRFMLFDGRHVVCVTHQITILGTQLSIGMFWVLAYRFNSMNSIITSRSRSTGLKLTDKLALSICINM